MNLKKLATVLLLACPLSVLSENGEIKSIGVAPKALFALGDMFAVGALAEAGYEESYRANLTLGFQPHPQHRIKAGGEYLLQNQDFVFTSISNRNVWVDQYAGGLGYQFLPMLGNSWLPLAFEVDGYYAYTPDKKVTDTARIAKANTYGADAGIVFELVTKTVVDMKARFDSTRFIYEYSSNETADSLGYSASVTQPFTDRVSAQIGADAANVYSNYYGSINYLFPLENGNAVELGFRGQFTDGRQGINNALVGLVNISYVGAVGQQSSPAQGAFSQTLLEYTDKPAVYMPLVLAKVEEQIGSLLSNIPDQFFNNILDTRDISSSFSGSPTNFSLSCNQTGGSTLQITSAGVLNIGASAGQFVPNPLSCTVTATYAGGNTVTSNTFSATSLFP
jgi:hypothetical protein